MAIQRRFCMARRKVDKLPPHWWFHLDSLWCTATGKDLLDCFADRNSCNSSSTHNSPSKAQCMCRKRTRTIGTAFVGRCLVCKYSSRCLCLQACTDTSSNKLCTISYRLLCRCQRIHRNWHHREYRYELAIRCLWNCSRIEFCTILFIQRRTSKSWDWYLETASKQCKTVCRHHCSWRRDSRTKGLVSFCLQRYQRHITARHLSTCWGQTRHGGTCDCQADSTHFAAWLWLQKNMEQLTQRHQWSQQF